MDYEIPLLNRENGGAAVLLAYIVNHTDTTDACRVSGDWAGWDPPL